MNPIKGFEGKRGGELGVIKEANSGIVFTWLMLLRKVLFQGCKGTGLSVLSHLGDD